MNYNDHAPPHFHARYGSDHALIEISGPALLAGWLPPRVLGLVVEWALQHREELAEDWRLATAEKPLRPIPPLE